MTQRSWILVAQKWSRGAWKSASSSLHLRGFTRIHTPLIFWAFNWARYMATPILNIHVSYGHSWLSLVSCCQKSVLIIKFNPAQQYSPINRAVNCLCYLSWNSVLPNLLNLQILIIKICLCNRTLFSICLMDFQIQPQSSTTCQYLCSMWWCRLCENGGAFGTINTKTAVHSDLIISAQV